MPPTDPNKPICTRCRERNAQPKFKGLCNRCYRGTVDHHLPASILGMDVGAMAAGAQTDDDWRRLAVQLGDVIKGLADGSIKASAAQVSIIKHIMDRGFGKVSKSQQDKAGPLGLVVLPVLDKGDSTHLCALCLEIHTKQHVTISVQEATDAGTVGA